MNQSFSTMRVCVLTLSGSGSVESLRVLLGRGLLLVRIAGARRSSIAMLLRWILRVAWAWRTAISLRYRWTHGILLVARLRWWVRHGRLQQRLVVPPCFDEFFVELREIV